MCAAVHVRVGHDDDAVIAQLGEIELVLADAATERGDQRADFRRRQHLVEARALDVQDLALQRQDRLGATIASLLGGAACGIALDDEQLRLRRVFLLAVRELAGQARDVERAFAPRQLARLACGLARASRVDDLVDDGFRLRGLLEQEFAELFAGDRLDHAFHFRRDQLVLGLRRELRVAQFHGHDGGETFARIVARGRHLVLLVRHLAFDVIVQRARERRAEAGEVRAAVLLRDVVGEAVHRLRVGVVPLQRDLDDDAVAFAAKPEDRFVNCSLAAVQVLDELLDAAFVEEDLAALVALVHQFDSYTGIQERKFAQALLQDLVFELDVGEDRVAGLEADRGAALVGRTRHRERRDRFTEAVFLRVDLAVAVDREVQGLRERVDDGHADAVQAARDLVRGVVELAARVQDGEDDFRRRDPLLRMDIHRNSTAVVLHGDGLVGVDGDDDVGAVTGERLVDRVVQDLEDHVVQAGPVIGVTDVHSRALADRIEAF